MILNLQVEVFDSTSLDEQALILRHAATAAGRYLLLRTTPMQIDDQEDLLADYPLCIKASINRSE